MLQKIKTVCAEVLLPFFPLTKAREGETSSPLFSSSKTHSRHNSSHSSPFSLLSKLNLDPLLVHASFTYLYLGLMGGGAMWSLSTTNAGFDLDTEGGGGADGL